VVLPPAGSVGLSDHLQKSTAFGIVDDAVEREQVLDITCLESDAPELHPADLGLGGADVASGLVAREPALLAQAPQARTEHDAPYGRSGTGRIDGHVVLLGRFLGTQSVTSRPKDHGPRPRSPFPPD